MFDNMKLVALLLIIASVSGNILLFKWHSQDKLRLEMLQHAKDLQPLGNKSSELLSIKYQALKNKFQTNEYNLRYQSPDQPPIDVKTVCNANNGVNCVYFNSDGMQYYGYGYKNR